MKKTFPDMLVAVLMLLLAAFPLMANAQSDSAMCNITAKVGNAILDLSQEICSETKVNLSVPKNYQRTYYWTPGGYTTNSIDVKPFETKTYSVTVIDTVAHDTCTNSVRIKVRPRFSTNVVQRKLTCSNNESDFGKTAQIEASASGGSGQFTYEWVDIPHYQQMDPDNTVAIGLKAYKKYKVKITDTSCGCVQYDSITTKAFPSPDIVISCEPGDSVYLQNPDVTFSFENHSDSINIDHFFWTFEHDITSTQAEPVFTYVVPQINPPYTVSLTVYDDCGCDTTFTHEVFVMPVDLKIPTVFTPNGDQHNDKFVITTKTHSQTPGAKRGNNAADQDEEPLSKYYKSSELVVFNRWGRVVYSSDDYQNDWDGGGLSDGTYFYVLKCYGLKDVVQYQGSVMIITKGVGQ